MTQEQTIISAKNAVSLARDCIMPEHNYKEHFIAIFLNARNKPIKTSLVSMGTINASLVHPLPTFRPGIIAKAVSIVVLHNHPSGSLEPSESDLELTERLKKCGEILGIQLVDHIIFTGNGKYRSCMND